MNLLFDLKATQPNGSIKRHGGGIYGEAVLLRMIERGFSFQCFFDSRLWINPKIIQKLKEKKIPLFDIAASSLESIIAQHNIDLIYSCLPEHISNISSCKVIGTIHGLRNIETPYDFFTNYQLFGKYKIGLWQTIYAEMSGTRRKHFFDKTAQLIKKNNFRFITVSNHSKYSLLSQFPQIKEKDIKVFYSPSTVEFQHTIPDNSRKEKFFLMVSANRTEKNILRGVIALDNLFSKGLLNEYKVIITGWDAKKRNFIKRLLRPNGDIWGYSIKNKARFEIKGYISDEELQNLYKNAFAFIYPSLNEGFGYPPLEAMQYGTPVLASATSSIPEICGDAALYFMPMSIEEIMNRIIMITNSNIYNHYKQKALERFIYISNKQHSDLDALIDFIFSKT